MRFSSPAYQGEEIVHWDEQLSDSIYELSGDAVRIECAYPGH